MCYTSLHQTDVRDRFLINNERIPKWLFAYYVQELHFKIQSLTAQQGLEPFSPPLYPGFLALLAMYVFILEKIDVLVLETGIGGETDSTNVFPHPVATGITSIGLDHVQVLGSSVEEIAWHKAGIFKQGSPAFAVVQDDAILNVFRERAEEKHTAGGLQIVTDSRILDYNIKLSPDLSYQRRNAALAISLVESYLKSEDPLLSITDEVASTLQDTELPGKSQIIADKDNTWFISVAHNDISLKETISWFKRVVQQPGQVTYKALSAATKQIR
jgi:folylpolyglutamate synthase